VRGGGSFPVYLRVAGVHEVRLTLGDGELCSRGYLDEPSAYQQLCPTRGYEICRPLVRSSHWLVRRNFEFARNLTPYKNKGIRDKITVLKHRPGVCLHGETIPDSQQFQHDEIITSPQGPSVFSDWTYTFSDVEIVHQGFATSEFLVLGKLHQPQKMSFYESGDDSITCKKSNRKTACRPNILAVICFYS
jgi:hypothetical protein